jgi:hypothetical protein
VKDLDNFSAPRRQKRKPKRKMINQKKLKKRKFISLCSSAALLCSSANFYAALLISRSFLKSCKDAFPF